MATKTKAKATKKTPVANLIVSLIIDESGSMSSIKDQVLESTNDFIAKLSEREENVFLTLVKFGTHLDDNIETMYDVTPIKEVEMLTDQTYRPTGGTPLYDAIGKTVEIMRKKAHAMETIPGVLCVVQTDGMENASTEFTTPEQIAAMIKEQEDVDGWTFLFLGADQDAWGNAQSMGFSGGNTVSYAASDHAGTTQTMAVAAMSYAGKNVTRTAQGKSMTSNKHFFKDFSEEDDISEEGVNKGKDDKTAK